MLVIALDTSTPAVTAGLVALDNSGEPGLASTRVLAERVTVNPRAHGELLTPHVLDVLAEAGLRHADLDAVVVGAGPGPFTGLRVGMVTATALGHATDKPVYPVCSLDGIAASAEAGDRLLVATDARRREVYWAVYDGRERVTGPAVGRPDEVAQEIETLDVRSAVGEKAELFDVESLPVTSPSARGLVSAAAGALLAHREPDPVPPLYLRRPDAKEPAARKPVTTGRDLL